MGLLKGQVAYSTVLSNAIFFDGLLHLYLTHDLDELCIGNTPASQKTAESLLAFFKAEVGPVMLLERTDRGHVFELRGKYLNVSLYVENEKIVAITLLDISVDALKHESPVSQPDH